MCGHYYVKYTVGYVLVNPVTIAIDIVRGVDCFLLTALARGSGEEAERLGRRGKLSIK